MAASADPRYHSILDRTVGVVFLGCPLLGFAVRKRGLKVAAVAKLLGSSSDAKILEDLKENSPKLVDLQHEFCVLAQQKDYNVLCCFERRKSNVGERIFLFWNRKRKASIWPQDSL